MLFWQLGLIHPQNFFYYYYGWKANFAKGA